MRVFTVSAGALIVMVATPGAALAQAVPPKADATPAPSAGATPKPAHEHLRLDIDRHVDTVVSRHESSDLPHFEDRIEVPRASFSTAFARTIESAWP